jgi:hypothetical protein
VKQDSNPAPPRGGSTRAAASRIFRGLMSARSRIAYLRKPAHAGQQWFGRGVDALMPTNATRG